MNEHSFIRSIHRKLPDSIKVWKINDAYQGGIPDALYIAKKTLWVEYKYTKALPKRPNTIVRHSMTPQQQLWLERLNCADTQAVLVLGSPKKCCIISTSFDQPISVSEYKERCISVDQYISWLVTITKGQG